MYDHTDPVQFEARTAEFAQEIYGQCQIKGRTWGTYSPKFGTTNKINYKNGKYVVKNISGKKIINQVMCDTAREAFDVWRGFNS